jgi:hypothetical protein
MCSMNVARNRLFQLTVLAAALGASGRAHSEPLPDEATRLFQEGRAALGNEDYKLASTYFEQSYQLDPGLGTLLNLAVCEEKLGKLRVALAHLHVAREIAELADRRRPLVEHRIAQLEARLPRLTVRRSSTIDASVTLSLDELPLAASEIATTIRIDPGRHVLDCEGPHGERCTTVFTVSEGEEIEQIAVVTHRSVASPAPPTTIVVAAAPPPNAPPVSTAQERRSVAYAVGGFGLATLVVGAIAGVGVLRQKGIVDSHCDERGCDAEGFAAAEKGSTLSAISTAATVIGVAGIGASAFLFLSAPTSQRAGVSLAVGGSF